MSNRYPKEKKLPKDKVFKATRGVRFRWSGDNLRRTEAILVDGIVLIPESRTRGSRRHWVELEKNESLYKSREDMKRVLNKKADVFYYWDEDASKIEKVFRTTRAGGLVAYMPEGAGDEFFGSYKYSRAAKDGELFKTKRQAVNFGVKKLKLTCAENQKQVVNISKQIALLQKQL